MSAIELKPCPFCGGEAYTGYSEYAYNEVDSVICGKCDARIFSSRCVEKWNMRSTLEAAPVVEENLIAECVEIAECIHDIPLKKHEAAALIQSSVESYHARECAKCGKDPSCE